MPLKKKPVGRPRKKVQINIRLDLATKRTLKKLARTCGITQTELLTNLILQA